MKRTTKSIFALVVVIAMCVSFCVPTFAEAATVIANAADTAVCPGNTVTHTKDNCEYEMVSKTEAGCGQQGYTTYKCKECGKYFLADFVAKPNDHAWVVDETTKVEGDCTTDSYEKKTCSLCGIESVTTETAPGHDMGAWVTSGFACGTAGASATRACNNCGYTETEALDAADHTWVINKINTEPTCGNPGEAEFKCSVCAETKTVVVLAPADAHTWVITETITAPTCSATGLGKAKCSTCGVTDDAYVIPAVNEDHVWTDIEYKAPTCTEAGNTAGKVCEKCGTAKADETSTEIPASGHRNEQVGYTAPTCDVDGARVYECSVCGTVTTVTIPMNGHSYGTEPTSKIEPTCTEYGYYFYGCTICGYVDDEGLVRVSPLGHNFVKDTTASTEPTCTATGTYVYACDRDDCTVTYTDENPIPAKGHTWVPNVTNPTCKNPGYTVDECSACDEVSEPYAPTAPNPDNHTLVTEISTAATCSTNGLYLTYCVDCSYRTDAVIPAFNHTYNSDLHEGKTGSAWENVGAATEASCNNPSTQYQECALCDATQTITIGTANGHNYNVADGATEVVTAPTCTTAGYTTYTCANCDQTWVTAPVSATGHSFVEDATTHPTTCQGMGKIVTTCANDCGYYAERENGVAYEASNPAHHLNGSYVGLYREGTCKVEGLNDYKCADCGTHYYVALDDNTGKGCEYFKTNEIDANAATCLDDGNTYGYTCSSCGTVYGNETLEALGHANDVTLQAVAPTCTAAGKEAGVKCSRCDVITTAQATVPALGHLDDITLDEVLPTCTATGLTAGVQCSRCNVKTTAQVTVSALGHDDQIFADRLVNCEEFGYDYFVCTRCGDAHEYVDNYVRALGHNYVEDAHEDATCTEAGFTVYVCLNDHAHTYTTAIETNGNHKNAAGDILVDSCGNKNVTDRVCAECGETVTITADQHDNLIDVIAEANCVNFSYKAKICTTCGYEKLIEEGTTLGDHVWGAWVETVAPGINSTGTKVRECTVCGEDDEDTIPTINGIMFEYEMFTAAVNNDVYSVTNGRTFVNAGLIAVVVSTYAESIDVSNILLNLNYDVDVLTFIKGEYTGDARFNAVVTAPANANGKVVVEANTFDAATLTMSDVTLDGENTFAVLYFAVNTNVVSGTEININVVTDETVDGASYVGNSAAEPVHAEFGGENGVVATATTSAKLADVSGNGVIDASDVAALAAAAQGGEYKAEADINKDGYVNAIDFALLRQYLAGNLDYEDMCK